MCDKKMKYFRCDGCDTYPCMISVRGEESNPSECPYGILPIEDVCFKDVTIAEFLKEII